jgi:hypothetical protein
MKMVLNTLSVPRLLNKKRGWNLSMYYYRSSCMFRSLHCYFFHYLIALIVTPFWHLNEQDLYFFRSGFRNVSLPDLHSQ